VRVGSLEIFEGKLFGFIHQMRPNIERSNLAGGRTTTSANGTPDLFAALNVATGEVLARCKAQHRAQDFVAFLREI